MNGGDELMFYDQGGLLVLTISLRNTGSQVRHQDAVQRWRDG